MSPKRSLLVGLAVVLLVPLGSGVAQTSDVEPDQDALYEVPSEAAGDGGATWLIVMDRFPWGHSAPEDVMNANGIAYDVIGSSDLAATELGDYSAVLVPSVQKFSYYQALNANAAQISTYVQNGGLLVVHGAQFPSTQATTGFLPGCAQYAQKLNDQSTIVDESSPIVGGVPKSVLQGWVYTAFGTFEGLPLLTSTIIENGAGDPTYVTYPWGSGSVFATTMILEWVFSEGPPRSLIMHNEVGLDPLDHEDSLGGLINVLTSPC